MDAFLAGYETLCRVGLLLAPDHCNYGFHATGNASWRFKNRN
jgi:hypothetical protein